MKSVMKHSFSSVPGPKIQRSKFNRSHGYKTTFDGGDLVPFFVDEVLPGDSFALNTHHFARLATPIAPFMDNARLTFFYFFVPSRLVWDNFQRFMGQQDNPDDTTDYLIPTLTGGSAGAQKLADYFGIMDVNKTAPDSARAFPKGISSLPFRAYNLIWNEWFRDQNLQDSVPVPKGDGPDDAAVNYKVLKRNKRHDYFTSALPWPQKGDPVAFDITNLSGYVNDSSVVGNNDVAQFVNNASGTISLAMSDGHVIGFQAQPQGNGDFKYKPDSLMGRLSDSSVTIDEGISITVNELRESFQLQRMLERDARGGTRYTEIILSHFGVHSPDARLQRPEYLGGGSSYVNINPVTQQSSTDDTSPQGNLAAFGTTSGRSGFRKSFTEHGYIIGLVCATADLTYQQGLNRMWTRRTRYDFYWPSLSHLGEQPVYNYEIYNKPTGEDMDEDIFGYQERYAEYRYKPSQITGLFNSNYEGNLDIWHLSQDFSVQPHLNDEFITENPPFKRVSAVPSEPDFILDMYMNLQCARPMPVYSIPGLIDHF